MTSRCGSRWVTMLLFLAAATISTTLRAEETYEPGGPLMGVKLPLYPTRFGEPAGQPGAIPELAAQAKVADPNSTDFTPQGMAPVPQLYPGSVEHWRTYFGKYLSIKSFFDRQSLIRNWIAAKDIAGVDQATIENYAEPVYWVPRHESERDTGKRNPPVAVVRAKIGTTFKLDLGELTEGMYALRVVGAVETKSLQRHRLPLLMSMTVNDGLAGQSTTYKLRCGYVDEFYSVAEFYFHAPVKRAYQATIQVDAGSMVDLLIHNIDLHDALAGAVKKAIKTKVSLAKNPGPVQPTPNTPQRLQRDDMWWNAHAPINAQQGYIYGGGGDDGVANRPVFGVGGLSPKEISEQHGDWVTVPIDEKNKGGFLVNKKLNLTYSMADFAAFKPLPDPYPFKDDGRGIFTAAAKPEDKPFNFIPVAEKVRERIGFLGSGALAQWINQGDVDAGRDAAISLIRFAYQYPSIDPIPNSLAAVMTQPGAYGRDMRCRRRITNYDTEPMLLAYDTLFPLIQGNEELAQSVQRYIPWIKSSKDVIALLDTYLVQTAAKRYMRYHYHWSNEPTKITVPAMVLGDRQITDDWMRWLFNRTFIYPLPASGLGDLVTTANDRDGIGYIGSYFYSQGEESSATGEQLEAYINAGGNPTYDLRDPAQYPKVQAATFWPLRCRMAGLYFPRIGDVTGPDKGYGSWIDSLVSTSKRGFRWTGDPKLAYVIKVLDKEPIRADEAGQKIEKAAATLTRAPWLTQTSRSISNWFTLLESGIEHDDYRFRRNVYLRTGQGWGHQHADSLDLQGHAHGYPFTIDGGQRSGYSSPSDTTTLVHNLVIVDGKGWLGHAWSTALSDTAPARYTAAQGIPPLNHPEVTLYRRQVALIDVDEGQGSKPLTMDQLKPTAKLDPNVTTANSYVFDVFRVQGGKSHAYAFHGPIDDELVTNTLDPVPAAQVPAEQKGLEARFPTAVEGFDQSNKTFAGKAPQVLQATWRFSRDPVHGSEPRFASANYDPQSPRKYTRLHVLGQQDQRVSTGWAHCRYLKYGFTQLFVTRQGDAAAQGSAFPAIIEPYVGQPFVTSVRLLPVTGNETDARAAVAVEVKTRQGYTDLLLADGRPEKTRQVEQTRFAGEFGFISRDGQGLRAATLTGGRELTAADLSLKPALAQRGGKVVAVDYAKRTLTIDQPWTMPQIPERIFEIGTDTRMTSYTLASSSTDGKQSTLAVTHGAQFYLSRVREVDAQQGIVVTAIGLPFQENGISPGLDKNWVASNEKGTKFWRAEFLGGSRDEGRYNFKLTGAPVSAADFGDEGGLRLWEYGVGDQVRQSAFVALRCLDAGVYELFADVDLSIALPGRSLEISKDGKAWTALPSKPDGKLVQAAIKLTDLDAAGKAQLRVK